MTTPRYTILLCDDDRLILATVSAALRSAGMEVIEADNGDDAILLARQHRPDLAMLDMRMNGKSGLDVAAYLRDYVGTPFLFLSAFGDEASVRQAKTFGAIEYLVKPVDARRLVEVVRSIVTGLAEPRLQLAGGELPVAQALAGEPSEPPVWSRDVSVAVGVLMERHALTRQASLLRLMALSRASGQSLEVVAGDLLDRLERLITERAGGAPTA